jgi:hypothetical protein
MSEQDKKEIQAYLDRRERILKGRLQYYTRYRLEIKEGAAYADAQINAYLDELKLIWEAKEILKND